MEWAKLLRLSALAQLENLEISSYKPTYFLTPPRPYPPSGPIRLGAIITSPMQPDEPLHGPNLATTKNVSTFTEYKWSGSHHNKTSSRYGVWSCFLEMVLGAGVDVTVKLDKETTQSWTADSMTTMSFYPSDTFLAEAVSHDDVRNYITTHMFREKIYMITGVMIAPSTTTFRESLEEKGIYVHAQRSTWMEFHSRWSKSMDFHSIHEIPVLTGVGKH
ncbi:hypothetical protein CC86DRAFT_384533 [Ophiobolus disseminans]|uniref:Uncharacterized protein n=1 Tax=Ophiobolus disseminans TaxID=1469910 RepID=A0A6A6ZUN5_9PLEO|nr:hypothetical protein CC86DRAFT_384533 [Ophiobolus disseminans]